MLVLKEIKKSFKEKVVFSNLSLEVQKGEMVAIVGESGGGKTTLLNCIGQIEKIDEGNIFWNNKEIKNKKEFFKNEVGFLFQNFALIENETVQKNLKIVEKNVETIEQSLRELGIEGLLNHKVYTLSGGEQQRVALARLILKNANLILADEPTASLDSENAKIVYQTLRKLNEKGATVLVVTHDLSFAGQFDRIISLSKG